MRSARPPAASPPSAGCSSSSNAVAPLVTQGTRRRVSAGTGDGRRRASGGDRVAWLPPSREEVALGVRRNRDRREAILASVVTEDRCRWPEALKRAVEAEEE